MRRSRSPRRFAARGRWRRRGTTHGCSRTPSPVQLPQDAVPTLERFAELRSASPEHARSRGGSRAPTRAQGGRRRSAVAAARAHRSGDGAGARRGARRAAARGGPRPQRPRNRALTRRYDRRGEALRHLHARPCRSASSSGADPHVRLRLDRVPAHPRRQLEAVRPRHVAPQLAAPHRLRRDARAQHHRRRRQGLRRGGEAGHPESRARRARDAVVLRGHGRSRPRPPGCRAARDRDDPGDRRVHRGPARAGHGLRGERRRLLPRRALPRVRTALRARSSRR